MADINIGQFSEALNDKMDRDSGNANPAVAKQSDLATLQATIEQLQTTVATLQGEISKMLGRMDYTKAIEQNNITSYTCPTDGYIIIRESSSGNYCLINSKPITSNTPNSFIDHIYPVSQGDVLTTRAGIGYSVSITFVPQKS